MMLFFVQNAAEVESKGVEMDMRWAATEELTIGFAATYLNNEYTKFPNAPCQMLTTVVIVLVEALKRRLEMQQVIPMYFHLSGLIT